MKNKITNSNRRNFIGTITTGAAALGMSTIIPSLSFAKSFNINEGVEGADEWFNDINGKHRIIYDATKPHEIMPFVWPRVFLMTNESTGTPPNECSVVVVLRHDAIGYAMEDRLWSKYNLAELFKANTPFTDKPATKNDFWKPAPGTFKVPGFGEVKIGINELQESGVKFCVCNAALTVNSAVIAEKKGMKPEEVYKDWISGILPGIQIVPSGVWAVGRAQEHGCSYCFAG